jgi:hypothetical protein
MVYINTVIIIADDIRWRGLQIHKSALEYATYFGVSFYLVRIPVLKNFVTVFYEYLMFLQEMLHLNIFIPYYKLKQRNRKYIYLKK